MHDFKPILNGLLPILSTDQWMEVESHIQHGEPVLALEKALRFADSNLMHLPRDTYVRVKAILDQRGSQMASPVFLNPLERTDEERRQAMRDYAEGARKILGLLDPYLVPGTKSSLSALIDEGAFHAAISRAAEGVALPEPVEATVSSFLAWCELENRFTS